MRTRLRPIGNSAGVIVPRTMLAYVGLVDEVDIVVEKDAILLRKPRKTRGGWADASRAIAAAADDGLSWPDAAPAGARRG